MALTIWAVIVVVVLWLLIGLLWRGAPRRRATDTPLGVLAQSRRDRRAGSNGMPRYPRPPPPPNPPPPPDYMRARRYDDDRQRDIRDNDDVLPLLGMAAAIELDLASEPKGDACASSSDCDSGGIGGGDFTSGGSIDGGSFSTGGDF